MIDVTFHVWCDGHDNGEHCEAEFFHEQIDSLGDLAKLYGQVDKRGWRILRLHHGNRRLLCPLHAEATEDDQESKQ
jgi:hypothetical protein